MSINVAQILRQAALRHPERVGVVELGREGRPRSEHTFAELDQAAARLAALLPSDARVGLLADNGLACVVGWFGAVYAGATLVPIPPTSAPTEAAARLNHSRATVLLVDAAHADVVDPIARMHRGALEVIPIETALEPGGRALAFPFASRASDTALILYTSGTVGRARGAAITHASLLLHTAILAHHALGLGPDDTVLGVLPLSHSYGCRMAMLAPFYVAARTVLAPAFSARDTLRAMAAEGVTWVAGVPTMYAAWAAIEEASPPPGLRWCLSAGAPLSQDVRRRAEERLGTSIREGYGLTEATFATIDLPPDPPTPGSVGRPVWGVEVRVVDEALADVAPGETGEVLLRGHNAMSGYWDDRGATSAVVHQGWLRTGDLGRLDDAGRLWVIDRVKDLILRGGHSIYPSEIEDAIATHPAVADVAVVGLPDSFYGEEVAAVVVLREGAGVDLAVVREHLRPRLAPHKLPVALAIAPELPLGPSRKVLKRTLRAWLGDGTLAAERL